MVFSAKRIFSLSWLPLLKGRFFFLGSLWRGSCRALARLRERKNVVTTPQSPTAPAPLTRGARSAGRIDFRFFCPLLLNEYFHFLGSLWRGSCWASARLRERGLRASFKLFPLSLPPSKLRFATSLVRGRLDAFRTILFLAQRRLVYVPIRHK